MASAIPNWSSSARQRQGRDSKKKNINKRKVKRASEQWYGEITLPFPLGEDEKLQSLPIMYLSISLVISSMLEEMFERKFEKTGKLSSVLCNLLAS